MKSFGLVNVKAFENTGDIELAPITIFVGQNSCGKSSILRFPAVLSQSLSNKDSSICLHSNKPGMIDFGNINDVIHNQSGKTFAFTCRYSFDQIFQNYDDNYDEFFQNNDDWQFVSNPSEKAFETDIFQLDVKVAISFGRIDNKKDSAIILKQGYQEDPFFTTGQVALT